VSTLTQSQAPINPPAHTALPGPGSRRALARLLGLHLASRRIPAALAALAVCAPLLQWAVRAALGQGETPGAQTSAVQLSLLVETLAAAVVSAAVHDPFGEAERATGRRLPWLRLATALILTVCALAALAAGAAGTGLPGGELALLRDGAGLIGIGLLGTVAIGGNFAWTGPAAYFVIAASAVSAEWNSPWTWPARPSHDTGAALCATVLLVLAILAITIIGPRQHTRE
jgi:hypothetical protein